MVNVAYNAFAPVRRLADGKASTTLLASVVVLALLLCHGAMGGFHQLAPQPASHADHASALTDASAEASPQAGQDEGHNAPYLPPPGFYSAALLVVLLASLLGAALGGGVPGDASAAGSWAARRPPPAAFLPTRPPAASSLQVFRL